MTMAGGSGMASGGASDLFADEGWDAGDAGDIARILGGTALAGAGGAGVAAGIGGAAMASNPLGWLVAALGALGNAGIGAYEGHQRRIGDSYDTHALDNAGSGGPNDLLAMVQQQMHDANVKLRAGDTAGYQGATGDVARGLAGQGLSPAEISMIMSRATGGGNGGGYGFVSKENLRDSMI